MRIALALACMALMPAAAQASPDYTAVTFEGECLAGQNINPEIQARNGNVMRLIVGPYGGAGEGLPCIQAAHDAGIKVYLTIQFHDDWSPSHVAAYFQQVLPEYAPYVWAVAVGNEQDLSVGGSLGGRVCSGSSSTRTILVSPPHTTVRVKRVRVRRLVRRHHRWVWVHRHKTIRTRVFHPATYGTKRLAAHSCALAAGGQDYLADWNAAEPVIASIAPHALRVYGDFSPWGYDYIGQGFATGVPSGVDAVAVHCYNTRFGGLQNVSAEAGWLADYHVPLWCSEMAPSLDGSSINAYQQTADAWDADLQAVEQASPNLQMVSYYNWPGL